MQKKLNIQLPLILQFAQGIDREQLGADLLRQSAILYQITIMGEATKRLSREFRKYKEY